LYHCPVCGQDSVYVARDVPYGAVSSSVRPINSKEELVAFRLAGDKERIIKCFSCWGRDTDDD
jgi:hypothetical protein